MNRTLSPFLETGFHGDLYLIEMLFACARRCQQFVETGTNVGSSLHYFAKNFPAIPCYSCEPDADAANFAKDKTAELRNVQIANQASPDFLYNLPKFGATNGETLFWLDSHGYGFKWPLKDEVSFITKNFSKACLFIDDCKVPGQPQFLFDEYDGQICGFEEIESSLAPEISYRLVYPRYSEKTSKFHPLKGWILIEYGFAQLTAIPSGLSEKIQVMEHRRNI